MECDEEFWAVNHYHSLALHSQNCDKKIDDVLSLKGSRIYLLQSVRYLEIL